MTLGHSNVIKRSLRKLLNFFMHHLLPSEKLVLKMIDELKKEQ